MIHCYCDPFTAATFITKYNDYLCGKCFDAREKAEELLKNDRFGKYHIVAEGYNKVLAFPQVVEHWIKVILEDGTPAQFSRTMRGFKHE